eukprot:CAMPEP_0194310256 /NCGR_PEP_ID=MMETSP0171-20130528/7183_1 /TAXON_ID=218684 /ORGANISM="Corethron pennatum, Strain L29A3" /LENGTH=408 /DNA_ID=CAMNT_0039063781 /DNA_START=8 /DNA_END=1234 /DNA_ORIENTATION=-
MILRKYIQRRLSAYFSQPENAVIGTLPSPVDFRSLWGEAHYRRVVASLRPYAADGGDDEAAGRWLTPAELFRPHYGRIVGRYISDHFERTAAATGRPLRILEIGGGGGTLAASLLDYLAEERPGLYETATYTLMDGSATLLNLQRRTLERFGSKVFFFRADVGDVVDSCGLDSYIGTSDAPTYVCGFELLDNLPHDKVTRCSVTGGIFQTELHPDDDDSGTLSERCVPLTDPLLTKILERVPSYEAGRGGRWIPTVACALMDEIYRARPNARLILADFDSLPPPDLCDRSWPLPEGRGAAAATRPALGRPLVTCLDGIDHGCYLRSPQLCDILFPTDFRRLASYASAAAAAGEEGDDGPGHEVMVQKQGDFLAGPEVEATKSWITGYTPLLEDFSNCSVLTAAPPEKK